MHPNQIGTAEVISFRTTRFDPAFKYPVEGVLTGTSISHIALRVTFVQNATTQQLFAKYIDNNPNIIYDDKLIDPVSKQKMYEIYFSFWPDTSIIGLQTTPNKLLSYEHDCDDAALGSPMTYNPRYAKYFNFGSLRETVSPVQPVFGNLFNYQISASLPTIFHEVRLRNALHNDPGIDTVVASVATYCRLYDRWYEVRIAQNNAQKSCANNKAKLNNINSAVETARQALAAQRKRVRTEFKAILFDGDKISYATLMDQLEQYLTIGREELDSISLPIVHQLCSSKNCGLELEPMLAYIQTVANNPQKYTYNVLTFNCADAVLQVLANGASACKHNLLQKAFRLPFYLRLIPTTPAMVMQMANSALKIESVIHTQAINCRTDEEFCKPRSKPTAYYTLIKRKPSFLLNAPTPHPMLALYASKVASATEQTDFRSRPGNLYKHP